MKKISKKSIDFLKEIKENNNKIWFLENKQRYLDIRKDLLLFGEHWYSEICKFDESIQNQHSHPHMFRIYKDPRYSKGSIYKTNYGLFICHGGKPNIDSKSGYFLHIEPGNSFLGAGAFHPDSDWLKSIRNKISEHGYEFRNIVGSQEFSEYFELLGNKLKTSPRGISRDHPEIELLRYKNIYIKYHFTDKEILSADFFEKIVEISKIIYPFNNYLNKK